MSPASPKQSTGFHILGKQSRRSACDRCRDQKLRCVHHDPRVLSCDRCQRFGVTCTHNHTSGKPATKTGKRLSAIEGRKRRATVTPPNEKSKRAGSSIPSHPAGADETSSGNSSNFFSITSPHDDWLLDLELNDTTLSGTDNGLGPDPIDWDFDNCTGQAVSHNCASDVDNLQTGFGACDSDSQPVATTVQKLHDLDHRVSQLLSVFKSCKIRKNTVFCDEWECKPMSDVLDASQSLLDLVRSETNTADIATTLLIATVYARLLSVFNELFAYMISGLASTVNTGVDSLFPSPIEKEFNISPRSDFSSSGHATVDFQLVGLQVRGGFNLKLRIFVETCTYMLDRLEAQFRGPKGIGPGFGMPETTWDQTPPSPVSVLDIVAYATQHNNGWSSLDGDRISMGTITRNIQHLKQILKVV